MGQVHRWAQWAHRCDAAKSIAAAGYKGYKSVLITANQALQPAAQLLRIGPAAEL